jgi:hypothetical protein
MDLVKPMQRHVANASVTASAVRQGRRAVKGVARAAINFLCNLNIEAVVAPNSFSDILDAHTEQLRRSLPEGAQYWGRARKCLNIFLREASYNCLLRTTFNLGELDELLETPLDKQVAEGLKRDAGARGLPPWTTIIALKPKQNEVYQTVAADVARELYNTHRANLDLWYWRPPPD